MIWLRLNRGQAALVVLSIGLMLGAMAAITLPSPALPQSEVPPPRGGGQTVFEPPLYAVANDPTSPLVENNPFDASRRPPTQRRTTTTDENAGLQPPVVPVNFVLLGTVVNAGGRNIAVIQGNPAVPGGGTYHAGEEVMPGYRLTRIARDVATVVGGGQTLELKIQKTSPRPGGDEEEQ